MSFSVKSSHKFVNPPIPQTQEVKYDDSLSADKQQQVVYKPTTNTDTNVKTGSTTGMAMRTSQSGLEDFY
jgi:hypothetical protein